jgi:hypothetical protein
MAEERWVINVRSGYGYAQRKDGSGVGAGASE